MNVAPSGITVLYEDPFLIAVEKPSGLLSVPGKSIRDCLLARVLVEFSDALLVHRLDRDTSGVLLFARDALMQRQIGRLFETRKICKSYTAIVDGVVTEDRIIDLPIRRDMSISLPPTYIVDHQQGRSAVTELTADSVNENRTRVVLKPHTGRSHQLRVHCKAIGHPIVGDPIYGDPSGCDRLKLHAQKLSFQHPVTNDILTVESPVPF